MKLCVFPTGKQRLQCAVLSLAITGVAILGFVSVFHGYQTYAVVPAVFGFLWAGFLIVLWKYCKQSMFKNLSDSGAESDTRDAVVSNDNNNCSALSEVVVNSDSAVRPVDLNPATLSQVQQQILQRSPATAPNDGALTTPDDVAVLRIASSSYVFPPSPIYGTAWHVYSFNGPPSYEAAVNGRNPPALAPNIAPTSELRHAVG